MPAKRYKVTLSAEERSGLTQLVNKGKAAARKLAHARILLLADEGEGGPGWKDDQIVAALSLSRSTVERVRQRWVMEGAEAALNHKRPYPTRPRLLDGGAEAHLVRLACSTPPDGRERWTMQLLADKLVTLGVVERVSDETVRQTLKKTTSSHG
jgi:transposase